MDLASIAAAMAASGVTNEAMVAIAGADIESATDMRSLVKIGDCFRAVNQLMLAERCYARARVLAPEIPAITFILGEVVELLGRTEEARALFTEVAGANVAAQLREIARLKAGCILPPIIPDAARIAADRARIAATVAVVPQAGAKDAFSAGGFSNFYLGYQAENDRDIQRAMVRYYLAFSPVLGAEAPHVRAPRDGKRIRLGLLSRHFFNHTIAYLNHGLIHGLDRDRFDLVLIRIPTGLPPDGVSHDLAAAADELCDLPLDFMRAREMIARLKLDVLHYPDLGMDSLGYFLAFARLARVQTVGWGHPVTTGLPTIDAFLSVDAMEPVDGADHYAEPLVRLAAPVPTVPKPPRPETIDPAAFGIDTTRPVYLCPQSLFKAHPAFDRICARILEKDPAAVVYFLALWEPLNTTFLARLRGALGAAAGRVRLVPRVSSAQFPALLACADVILDIPEWSGGKTSLEALAQGIPIVHWPGRFMRGRHTLAFYRQMGFMECVADSAEDYAERAYRLVHDREHRARVRGEIAARSSRLFDQPGAVREAEDIWIKALGRTRPLGGPPIGPPAECP